MRWQHPEKGLLPPLDFIPVAESSGLIEPLGQWVIEEACRQLADWRREGLAGESFMMSVNVSARQLSAPGLGGVVGAEIGSAGLSPSALCLEITESVLMTDADDGAETLHALKRLGVKLSIDDFGTGYSSLAYLHRFPIDVLKIDKTFVDGLGREPHAAAIVQAVIDLAHALGLSTVAEGVEHAEQVTELVALGCDAAQGYYFARPTPAAEVSKLLRDQLFEKLSVVAG